MRMTNALQKKDSKAHENPTPTMCLLRYYVPSLIVRAPLLGVPILPSVRQHPDE